MRLNPFSIFIFAIVFFSAADIAVTTKARKNLQVTIYRDFGIVKDVRTVSLLKGSNRIRFEDVATGIKESTADFSWSGSRALDVLGQTYEFDLVSPTKLMEKYIGKELEIIPYNSNIVDTIPQVAELISIHGEEPVFRIGTKITYGQIGRILFPYVPENLFTKPTLILDVESQERQDIELTAQYVVDGISWNAVYSFDVNTKDATGNFGGWIQFDNQSGLSCKDAKIIFVAGYAHRISENDADLRRRTEKETGNFYFYSINRPVTLQDNQKKQIEWITGAKIKYQPGFCAEFFDSGMVSSGTVYSVAHIDNNQQNNLGLPLPGGIVRVSKSDAQQNSWFIGEDLLEDTKSNTAFDLKINAIQDIVATKRRVVEQGKNNNFITEIKNLKDKECIITVRDFCYPGYSIFSNDKFVLKSNYVEWKVRVLPGQVYRINFSLQKRS